MTPGDPVFRNMRVAVIPGSGLSWLRIVWETGGHLIEIFILGISKVSESRETEGGAFPG